MFLYFVYETQVNKRRSDYVYDRIADSFYLSRPHTERCIRAYQVQYSVSQTSLLDPWEPQWSRSIFTCSTQGATWRLTAASTWIDGEEGNEQEAKGLVDRYLQSIQSRLEVVLVH